MDDGQTRANVTVLTLFLHFSIYDYSSFVGRRSSVLTMAQSSQCIRLLLVSVLLPNVHAFSFARLGTRGRTFSPSLRRFKYKPAAATVQDDLVNQLQPTVQDESVDAPASMVFYDDLPEGIVCARGVCVLPEDFDDDFPGDENMFQEFLSSYLGPRLLLGGASILYGTNFALGTIMNDSLPASAATSARMFLAAGALSPFLFKLDPKLAGSALLCGCFTALGYITQSLALVDTSPATVAFLGAATVIVCPALEFLVNKKPMGLRDAPQTWLAAALCLMGVGILELYDPSGTTGMAHQPGWGDVLSILQAVGFGTSFFLTERMMRGQPDQALPITAVQVFVSAFLSMVWCHADGWIGTNNDSFGLPGLFMEPAIRMVAGAVVWTGLVTTALNRFVETSALGKVSSAEASVILATEPLWAALFAALLLSENFGVNDYAGGVLIVLACLANTMKPSDFDKLWKEDNPALE